MRKPVLFLAVLFVSVLCTACINNIAIQELNNKAQEYMQKGDIQNAISRLESSVDLDGNMVETRYNLGVAYISAEEFKKAQTQLEYALKLKPDFANAYYSLALAQESDGLEILNPKSEDEAQEEVEVVTSDENDDGIKDISLADADYLVKKLNAAINSYKKYLELSPDNQDKEAVEKQIDYLQETASKYAQKYNINTDEAQQ